MSSQQEREENIKHLATLLSEMLEDSKYTPYECCIALLVVAANHAPPDGKRVCLSFFADALDGAEYIRNIQGEP